MNSTLIDAVLMLLLFACGGKNGDTTDTAGTDTDTAMDTDVDTDVDTDADADSDVSLWEHCPDSTAHVGEGTGTLQVTAEAVYCGTFNEGRTLEQEMEAKTLLKIVEGTYPVPVVEGTSEFALAVCTRRADVDDQPAISGVGVTETSLNTWSGTTYTWLEGSQPLASENGSIWSLDHTIVLVGKEGSEPEPLTMDGGPWDSATGAGAWFRLYREGTDPYDVTTITPNPCDDPTWNLNVHTVTFEGGEIELHLRIGVSMVSTEPGAFVYAAGTLDGTSFVQEDYFKLIYRPEHHHFGRHFAVIFDTPIGDACAIRVENIDPWEGDPTAVVSTADCDLSILENRPVESESFVKEE